MEKLYTFYNFLDTMEKLLKKLNICYKFTILIKIEKSSPIPKLFVYHCLPKGGGIITFNFLFGKEQKQVFG